MLVIAFPNIDPYILHFGKLGVTWYSLSYVTGILIGWKYSLYLIKKTFSKIKDKDFDDYITWLIISIVVGGRLGHVILYEPIRYINNPIEILKTYEGGMSFHGGILGVIISSYIFCNMKKINFLELTDILAQAAPIGLFLGRIANFINGELFGSITSMPWGVIFPDGGCEPRHPSQIYESIAEGILLFVLLLFCSFKIKLYKKLGALSGVFLSGYAVARFFCEFYRVPDFEYMGLTSGQLYSFPMFILGLYFIFIYNGHKNRNF